MNIDVGEYIMLPPMDVGTRVLCSLSALNVTQSMQFIHRPAVVLIGSWGHVVASRPSPTCASPSRSRPGWSDHGAPLAKLPGGSAVLPGPRPGGPPREQPEATSPTRRRLAFAVDAVLHAYSQVVFSHSKPIGVALLLASFVVPDVGAVGLLGVVLACALALLMQMDREAVRSGVLGYNALLVFLAIGAMFDRSPTFWGLAAVTAMAVVLFHVALSGALAYHFRLPVLSLPFVAVTWTIMAASPHIRGMAFHGHPPALDFGPFPGPELVDSFLRSLGAIFFQPHWTAGLIVFGALFAYSRIASVHALGASPWLWPPTPGCSRSARLPPPLRRLQLHRRGHRAAHLLRPQPRLAAAGRKSRHGTRERRPAHGAGPVGCRSWRCRSTLPCWWCCMPRTASTTRPRPVAFMRHPRPTSTGTARGSAASRARCRCRCSCRSRAPGSAPRATTVPTPTRVSGATA